MAVIKKLSRHAGLGKPTVNELLPMIMEEVALRMIRTELSVLRLRKSKSPCFLTATKVGSLTVALDMTDQVREAAAARTSERVARQPISTVLLLDGLRSNVSPRDAGLSFQSRQPGVSCTNGVPRRKPHVLADKVFSKQEAISNTR